MRVFCKEFSLILLFHRALATLAASALLLAFYADRLHGSEAAQTLPILVIDTESGTKLRENSYQTVKQESIRKEKLKESHRQNLGQLLADQVGVETQTACANCGAKRLSINGLKAEYTSILIDGLPMHSAVSSFYGVDSIPLLGISDVQIQRGSGASLTNPEAIGGTILITSRDAFEGQKLWQSSLVSNSKAQRSGQNHSFLFSQPSSTGNWAWLLGGQFHSQEAWDEDHNRVAESPQRQQYNAMAKLSLRPSAQHELHLRLGATQLEILGGPVGAQKPQGVRPIPAQQDDFSDGRVDRPYIGEPLRITDWVQLKRFETALHWSYFIDSQRSLHWNQGFAQQEQSSIYQHGYDYANLDRMYVSDGRLDWSLNPKNFLSLGLFWKQQNLRSASETLFTSNLLEEDDFAHQSLATYAKYTYAPNQDLELDFALRFDALDIDWLQLDNRVRRNILAPRLQIRRDWSEHLSTRASYGLGYRAPLSFFESQHGNNENAYQIDITELETAHSSLFAIDYNMPQYYVSASIFHNYLQNMAYGEYREGLPILYRNTSERFELWLYDILLGYKVSDDWMWEASYEWFQYPDSYTLKLPTAAIEQRLQLRYQYSKQKWSHSLQASWVGSRDLSRYANYRHHFFDRRQLPPPEQQGLLQKPQRAPAFVVIDTNLNYQLNRQWQLGLQLQNIFNQTQATFGDTPSAWHWHGDHAHYDALHTWGPNRGREFHLQATAEF